jgi:hypothetical protein
MGWFVVVSAGAIFQSTVCWTITKQYRKGLSTLNDATL